MDKQNVIYTYHGILFGYRKNEILENMLQQG